RVIVPGAVADAPARLDVELHHRPGAAVGPPGPPDVAVLARRGLLDNPVAPAGNVRVEPLKRHDPQRTATREDVNPLDEPLAGIAMTIGHVRAREVPTRVRDIRHPWRPARAAFRMAPHPQRRGGLVNEPATAATAATTSAPPPTRRQVRRPAVTAPSERSAG